MDIRNNFIKIFFILSLNFLVIPSVAFSASYIGQPCENNYTDSDCEVVNDLDCESSNIEPADNNLKTNVCTCNTPKDCADANPEISKIESDWICSNNIPDISFNLKYCRTKSMLYGDGKFAIDPLTPQKDQPYCLAYDQNKNFSCVPVPSDGHCKAANSVWIKSQDFTPFGDFSANSLSECSEIKNKIIASKFCNIDGTCTSNAITDCGKNTLYSTYKDCTEKLTLKNCAKQTDCSSDQICLDKKCYNKNDLMFTTENCTNDSECRADNKIGACISETIINLDGPSQTLSTCYYRISDKVSSLTQSIKCGSTSCVKSDKTCKVTTECQGFGGEGICKDGVCWLDEISMTKYKQTSSLLGLSAEIKIFDPILSINIPQLQFSKVASSVDSEGYLHLPYIGEYISAVYEFGMVVASIIAVIMIIVTGVKIITLGGEERVNGFKKIGQVIIGLFIIWGSYVILYTINPDLVTFKALKIKYIEPEELQTTSLTDSDLADAALGEGSPDKFKYFTKCPVNLTQPIYFKDGTSSPTPDLTKKPGNIKKNIPRRLEFHEKMVTQQILKGPVSQRVAMATEAAAQCQIHYENCGVGTTNVYALAAATGGSYGDSGKCLLNTDTTKPCNSIGNNTKYSPKKKLHDATGLKTSYGLKVTQLTRGMVCGANCKQQIWPEQCFTDKDQATAKLTSILTATGQWSPNWINELQPGDYYMIVNWNSYCPGTHSALFLGWKDPVNHVAWVQMGDAANFIRVGTKKLGKEAIIQISRPIEK